jgi:hypothetical protein
MRRAYTAYSHGSKKRLRLELRGWTLRPHPSASARLFFRSEMPKKDKLFPPDFVAAFPAIALNALTAAGEWFFPGCGRTFALLERGSAGVTREGFCRSSPLAHLEYFMRKTLYRIYLVLSIVWTLLSLAAQAHGVESCLPPSPPTPPARPSPTWSAPAARSTPCTSLTPRPAQDRPG